MRQMNSASALSQEPCSATQWSLTLTAVAALLLGTTVYLLDRDWSSTVFLETFIAHQRPKSTVFGVLGGSLPSLLHAYAICALLVVALWPWPRTRPWICLLWFGLASFLECLQSDAANLWFVAHERLAGEMPLMASLKGYVLQGQFDGIDLLATGIGCLAALSATTAITHHTQRNQT
jgi:hypothetical protein